MNLLPEPLPVVPLSARADITFPRATRLLFIFAPSCKDTCHALLFYFVLVHTISRMKPLELYLDYVKLRSD